MYKTKKTLLNIITISNIIIFNIELIKYLNTNSNIYGVYYLLTSLLIVFLLLPVTYNYKRNYSKARISKIILILIIGIFSSYFLQNIILQNMNYMDSSKLYLEKIFITKNVLKPIIYSLLLIFLIIETKVYLLLKKIYLPKSKQS